MLICGRRILSLICITFFLELIDAKCNVCQTNGAACINSTSFYLCHGNSFPNYDKLYHCKKGFDCSNLNAICVQSLASRPASCGDTSLCGLCSAHQNHLFACTSRTTFQMCYGASHPQSLIGYCPDGYVCNANTNSICVPFLEANDMTCDLFNPIESYLEDNSSTKSNEQIDISTVKSTSLPSLTAQEICDVEQKVGVFQIPGNSRCLEYVRCYMKRKMIFGSLAECPNGTYFSGETLQCTLIKPLYCL
ncbi:uncharacterized protein LOC129911739 [Episyrphus balteatus]|uniref:uncharacterized protein LOC129911739 n=1 Tax=Episyrphus balteatus TaxID=286459 RepID=UPI0024867E73|nr:uncharacterized protein LOC129911739 [Episyrphus balteatus]